jgi:hypothetical protein
VAAITIKINTSRQLDLKKKLLSNIPHAVYYEAGTESLDIIQIN